MKSESVSIINDAIHLNARNIHFRLVDNGNILIHFREGNLMLPTSYLDFEAYKKILDYIELHTVFEQSNQEQSQEGTLTLNEHPNVLECSVSILLTSKFKSLILRIKRPHVKGQEFTKSFKNNILRFTHLLLVRF